MRRPLVLLAAAAAAGLATVLSLVLGSSSLPPDEVLRALWAADDTATSLVVRELRLPRTCLGLVVGAALAVAGAQLQGLTRNPLADPGLLGVSAGAALGVVATGTVLGIGGAAGQVLAALVGAALAVVAVVALAGRGRRSAEPLSLALAGIAVTALLGSITTVLVLLDAQTLDEYRFWAVGSLADRDVSLLRPALPLLLVGAVLAVVTARSLDLLALGDDVARGLGTAVSRTRLLVIASATLLTAAAVSVAGPLTFVGLLVPHLARPFVGVAHRWLLPVCALLGGALLLVSDVVGRVVAPPAEVQVGVVTAFVGAPFLVWLVRRAPGRRRVAA